LQLSRSVILFAVAFTSAMASASDTMLILQTKVPLKEANDPNVQVSDLIAQELDNEGRVIPIVYSMSDPVFRKAYQDGRIKTHSDPPKLRDAFQVAKQLGATYLLVVGSAHEGKVVKSKAQLYKNQRQIWKDEQNLAVTMQDIVNPDVTARSLARTMVLRMNTGPLKGFVSRIKTQTPELSPGQGPTITEAQPPAVTISDNEKFKKDVGALIASGKRSNAIVMLRDAVDSSPFNLDFRLELIDVLLSENPQAAAEEARRAALLMPEKSELRAIGARAWMQAGHPEEAQKDLNEAIARDPSGSGTLVLLAELGITQLEPEKAIDHLDQAVKLHDDSYIRFLRAVCRGMLGGVDGMQNDLAASDKLDPHRSSGEAIRRYVFVADVTDRMLAKDAADIRVLTRKIVVNPKDKDVRDQIEQTARLIASRTALLTAIPPPADSKPIHERRLLAHKLISQCLEDLRIYSGNSDEDTLADCSVNLGEAMKQLSAIRTASTKS